MGLFHSKDRDEKDRDDKLRNAKYRDEPTGAHPPAEREAAGPPKAQPVARNQQPPTNGGRAVANIGKSITIKGDLTGNEDLVIEGQVEGTVALPNNQLTIGQNGNVRADINAKAVVIVGRVSGNVHGTERVEIQGSGVVEGDVSAPRLTIAEGAVLNGNITMTKAAAETVPKAPAAPAAPSAEVRRAG